MKKLTWEIRKRLDGKFDHAIRSHNKNTLMVLAEGDGFKRKSDAKRSRKKILEAILDGKVELVELKK